MMHHRLGSKRLKLTPSEEEYLEAVFKVSERSGGSAKTGELAKQLRIKAPSVVQMLEKLRGKGLMRYGRRAGANLTPKGRELAARIVRRHKLAERLLVDVFGQGLHKVHDDACKLEHAIDDELADRIDEALGRPDTCPHGDPIPTVDGRSAAAPRTGLTDVGEGEECTIVTIPEERETVQRLLSLNILPKSRVKVVEKLPRGAVLIQCGDTQIALSRDVASEILVKVGRRRARHRWGRGG